MLVLAKKLPLLITFFLSAEAFHQCSFSIHKESLLSPSLPSLSNLASTPNNAVDQTTPPPPNTDHEVDNLEKFSKDVKRVLYDLRGSDIDPTIPKYMRTTTSTLTYSHTWTLQDWEEHNSRRRYLRYIWNFPKSRLLHRIAPQQTALFLWSICSIWISRFFKKGTPIPLTSLGIISTFLAFLLTLRSNQGLSRLDEARRDWSKVVFYTREMSQLISYFIYPVDKQLGLLLARHVCLYGWLLKSQLRFTKREAVQDIVRTMLPNRADSSYVLSQRQKPVAVVTRIRQVIHHLGQKHLLTTAEEIALDHTAQSLNQVITSTGRLRASPIPTLYTSHTTRLLTFYLFFLPPALHWSGLDGLVSILVTMSVGFAMLGLDEISHLFEQPFRVIPMYQICKRSMTAVADAFTCRPPPLVGEESGGEKELPQNDLTLYWSKSESVDTME